MNIIEHFEQTNFMRTNLNFYKYFDLLLIAILVNVLVFPMFGNSFSGEPNHLGFLMVEAGDDQNICIGESVQLEATGANTYTWTPSTGLSCTQCPNPIASPFFTTTYFVIGDDNTVDSVKITVSPKPEILSVAGVDPTDCNLHDGTITIIAQGSAPLEYSTSGGSNWQANGSFTALASGNFPIAIRNVDGTCFVTGSTVILESPDTPEILDVLSTDPTACDIPDGSISIVTANNGNPLQYSVDGGQIWQSTNTFQLLIAGNYNIRVRNEDGTCEVSGGIISLSGSPEEAIITDVLSFPPSGCNMSNGQITILVANDNGNFEYSIDGGLNYQPSNIFFGLMEGVFNVLVRKNDGTCTVTGGFVEHISAARPELNGYSVIEPTGCGTNDGIITILASGTNILEYSITGGIAWQSDNSFPGLSPGTYQVQIRNIDGTCLTVGENIILTEPPSPTINNVFLTHPSGCGIDNGTITISATGTLSLEYSINNGITWSTNPTFTGLLAGTYEIAVALSGQFCPVTTTVSLSNPGSCIDTLSVNIPGNSTTTICLDATVLNISGTITGSSLCSQGNAANVIATTITGECITVGPAIGFTGVSPDLICSIHCYNNSTTQCDTTYIEITVDEVIECNVFQVDTLVVDFIGNPTNYCVPVSLISLLDFSLEFQGQLLNNPIICDPNQSFAYSYGALIGGGFDGPYTLDAWEINGVGFSGVFNDPFELADLMNAIDPSGFWQINTLSSIIFGGNFSNIYGNMEIVHDASGISSILVANFSPQAQGFNVQLTNPGEHILIATDTTTGCEDTLLINVIFEEPQTETVILTTTVNTPTQEYCLDGSELPIGMVQSIGFCEGAMFGNVPISNDSCVTYIPNQNFAGQDNFCVLVCDNSFPQICDTTYFTINVLPETDTVYLEIPAGASSVDTCLSTSIIELPGSIDQVSFCEIDNNEITGSINGNCLSFTAVNDFTGTTQICVEFCSNGFCDVTIIFINVIPVIICDEIFENDQIIIISPIDESPLCFPVPLSEIINYELLIDGIAYTAFSDCDFQEVIFYNYSSWTTFPFTLDGWNVNGNVFTGDFGDIQSLVDSMNVWDPSGDWEVNVSSATIIGGDSANNYGNLVLSEITTGILTITPDMAVIPMGSNLTVNGYGQHEIIINGPGGCSDTVLVDLQEHVVTSETLFFETDLNTTVEPICINTQDLLGNSMAVNLCSLPQNGSLSVLSDTCFAYTPSQNYAGQDEFCLVVCDDNQPMVCDTFFVNISINTHLPIDTLFLVASNELAFDTCLNSTFLQLPGPLDTAWVCGVDQTALDLIVNGTCLTIDMADDFSGTSTACVVHCTADVPPICDTTILVIEFDNAIPCDDFFDPDEVIVVLDNFIGEVCLSIPFSEISNYDAILDGLIYSGGFTGCDIDTVFEYPYLPSFGQGTQAPYAITWMFSGMLMVDTINNAAELVDLMNGWDPAGDWVLNTTNFRIVSSNQAGDYGLLTITNVGGFVENIDPIIGFNPLGTLITFVGKGEHEFVLIDPILGCDDTLFINAIDPANIIQITTIEGIPSEEECIDTTSLPGSFQTMTICGDPLNGTLVLNGNCFVYLPNPGYVGSDEACLEICDDLGNCESWIVQITVLPLCSQFDFFPDGVLEIEADDCASLTSFCLPVEFDSIGNFGVLINGVPFSNFELCNGSFAQISLDTGFHEIIVVHLMTQCMDTLLLNITCQSNNGCGFAAISNLDLLADDCESETEFCVEVPFADLPNFLVTDNGTPPSQIGPCSIDSQFVGVQLDTGFHELIFADTVKGCADTFLVNINCIVCPDYFPDDQLMASTSCENSSAIVCLPMDEATLANLVIDVDGLIVSDPLTPCGFDSLFTLVYSDLSSQGLVGPYQILEWTINGNSFAGFFSDADELADSMNIWDPNGNWLVEIVPPGDIIINGGNGGNTYGTMIVQQEVTGNIDTLVVQVEVIPTNFGLELPIGVSTVTFTDTTTNCAETVIADMVCVETQIYFDSVAVGDSDTFQLDLTELLGNLVSVENICEDLSGDNVSFEIVGETVIYTGISPGIDTACVVVCDDLNICDTTILIITAFVNDMDTTITAVDDAVITGEGQVVLIDVLQNDLFANLLDFFILDMPGHGQAAFLPNGSVNYVPDEGFCDDDVPDVFSYVICNSFGCDTALVSVIVSCDNLQIFNAFSPNGDNRNDFFKINGLQNYPDHKLYVYNRWGNLVFETAGYQNNWIGDWDGKDLPDGTYFYMLDLGDGNKPLSGYVQINR